MLRGCRASESVTTPLSPSTSRKKAMSRSDIEAYSSRLDTVAAVCAPLTNLLTSGWRHATLRQVFSANMRLRQSNSRYRRSYCMRDVATATLCSVRTRTYRLSIATFRELQTFTVSSSFRWCDQIQPEVTTPQSRGNRFSSRTTNDAASTVQLLLLWSLPHYFLSVQCLYFPTLQVPNLVVKAEVEVSHVFGKFDVNLSVC